MAKIMLVEDDNSLREIYEARLSAEGYTVVSAKDGEEALAMALKERPDLIIADVMMPKVSGFDMLDILRSTPETKNTKIIMMTALSQAEDRARAEKLGADRYLVKSQVTLEDVTREAHAILAELEKQSAATVARVSGESSNDSMPASAPASPSPSAPTTPAPAPTPAPAAAQAPQSDTTKPKITSIPVTASPDDDDDSTDAADDTKADATKGAVKVEVKDATLEKAAEDLSKPTKQEEAEVDEQVDEFIASNPTLSASPEPDTEKAKAATDAVNSLTTPAEGNAASDKPEDESTRAYVASTSDEKTAGGSLEHTKTITPTPDSERSSATPDLNALLAKEGEATPNSSPAVDSIINPEKGSTPQ